MTSTAAKSALAALASLGLAGAVAWAGSQGSTALGALSVVVLCALVSFGVNWLVFIPSYVWQTEHYFDLTGSVTYLALVFVALATSGSSDPRAILLALLVGSWALRLGIFLFTRIRADGSDRRHGGSPMRAGGGNFLEVPSSFCYTESGVPVRRNENR